MGELRESELRLLAQQCIDPDATQPLGAYVFAGGDRGADLARHVERTVFYEAFGDTPELMAKEYGPYEPTSVFICVLDHMRKLPVGVGRLVMPAPGGPGLKTLNDIPAVWGVPAAEMLSRGGLCIDPDQVWDVATLAVMPDYRKPASAGLVTSALYHVGLNMALRCGVDWMIAILDAPVMEMARLHFYAAFSPFEGAQPKRYMGSAQSYPVWFSASQWIDRIARADQDMFDYIVKGEGLKEMVRLPEWDKAVRLVEEVSRREPAGARSERPLVASGARAPRGFAETRRAPETVGP